MEGTIRRRYRALERRRASNGGLIQLSVRKYLDPWYSHTSIESKCNEFLTIVAKFCPKIEYLGGWKGEGYMDQKLDAVRRDVGLFARCVEGILPVVSATTRVQLFVAPFGDDYLNEFAQHPKLQLTKMAVACEYDEVALFESRVISEVHHRDEGFKLAEASVSNMLTACPALEELQILICGKAFRSPYLHDCITDSLLLSVAESCPRLKKLIIYETDIGITDAGLITISKLPLLSSIALKQTKCTFKGILALILNAPDPSFRRQIALNIGVENENRKNKFFEYVLAFMKFVITQPVDTFSDHVFEVKLVQHGDLHLADHDAALGELLMLDVQMFDQHPGIYMVFTYSYGDYKFDDQEMPESLKDIVSITFVSAKRLKKVVARRFRHTVETQKRPEVDRH